MKILLFFVSFFFPFWEIQASASTSFPDEHIVNLHCSLKQCVENQLADAGISSSAASSKSFTNTLGSFGFILRHLEREPTSLFPGNNAPTLFTSAASGEADVIPSFNDMEQHWEQYCPNGGELVCKSAQTVWEDIKTSLDFVVQSRSDQVESAFSKESVKSLIKMQEYFCLTDRNKEWSDAVHSLEESMANFSHIFTIKSVDSLKIKQIPLVSFPDDKEKKIKKITGAIIRHGWHAEQRMLFKAGNLIEAQSGEVPEEIVLCLYTDNAPCHSLENGAESKNKNQCQCRQTFHNLSQKHTLNEAFKLSENHPWKDVQFKVTVSFSYQYDMENVSDREKGMFAPWLFYLNGNNKLESWNNCPGKKGKSATVQSVTEGGDADGEEKKNKDTKKNVKKAQLEELPTSPVSLAEIERMHAKLCGSSQCGCSSAVDQWKHIQDLIQDLMPETGTVEDLTVNSNLHVLPSSQSDCKNEDYQPTSNNPVLRELLEGAKEKKHDETKCCVVS